MPKNSNALPVASGTGCHPRSPAYDARAAFDLARAADLSWRQGRPVAVQPIRTGTDIVYKMEGMP